MTSRSAHCPIVARLLLAVALCLSILTQTEGHGYLSQPRSRQLYAHEEGKWWCSDPDSCIRKEPEPWSANRRLPSDACGTIGGRTYHTAVTLAGNPAPFPIENTYTAGDVIEVTTTFTINHRGHIEFHICDQAEATEECFQSRPPLAFESTIDFYDPAYPERLYMDPRGSPSFLRVQGLKLPADLTCEHCVLQWTWYTANTCLPPGYRSTPASFRNSFALHLSDCPLPFDHTGNDARPERFWNCADIRITPRSLGATTAGPATTTATTQLPEVSTTVMPPSSTTTTPAPSPVTTRPPTSSTPSPASPSTTTTQQPTPITTTTTTTQVPPPSSPGGADACDASGSWPSDTCWPGSTGPCRGADTVCWQPYASGQCYAGTVDCRATTPGASPPSSTTTTVSPPSPTTTTPNAVTSSGPTTTTTLPPVTSTTASATTTTRPVTTSSTPAAGTTTTAAPPVSTCDATGSWPSSSCWPGTSGPCRGSNTVCWQPYPSGECYANTEDCRSAAPPPAGGNPPTTTTTTTSTPVAVTTTTTTTSPPVTSSQPATVGPTQQPGGTTTTTQQPSDPNRGKVFVMYYEGWATYGRDFQVADMDASTFTHINYGFANIANGRCVLGDAYADTQKSFAGDSWDQPLRGNFNQLLKLKRDHPHLRTLISVGGWTWSSQFSSVAATAASRSTFADSCVQFMQRYGFDGIDIDWEYPVEGGLTSSNNPADKENYTLLLRALRDALDAMGHQTDERPLLTIASSPNPAYMANMEVAALDGILDWVNVMTYDYNGAWQSTTAHNAPLYDNPSPGNPFPSFSIHNTVSAYLGAGLRPSKLVLGMPSYGRGWSSIPPGSSSTGLFESCGVGSCPSPGSWEAGVLDYKDIKSNYLGRAGYTRHWDAASRVPYLYNGDVFISYDDPESICLKSNYLMDNGFGGAMVWAASSDWNYELQQVIAQRVLDGSPCQARKRRSGRRMLQ